MTLGAEWKGSKFGNLDNDIVPIKNMLCLRFLMMASSDGNIFSVIGLLWGEFTCHRWIPLTKESDSELWCFFDVRPNKRLKKKHWNCRWFETWRHPCYVTVMWANLHCQRWILNENLHYSDTVMGAMAFQITRLTIVYLTVYSDADQRKHQSSTSLAFVRWIHQGPNSPHKWPLTRKMFPCDDVYMV